MNARAMPISSRTAEERLCACFCAKSPRMREVRSATDWQTLASSADSFGSAGCIPHDAICAGAALQASRVVKIVKMGYRLAHGEESLVRVERPAKQHAEQLARALRLAVEIGHQLLEALLVMRPQRGDAL